uniref:Uncharacterized protein n=1 Tax=Anopheles atroparvus TaxID=41427 RepID=A0A182IY21_ANOAO
MSMKIIIRLGERQHNFLLHGEDVCNTVAEVKEFCYCRFPHLETEKDLKVYWIDQDGDDICVVTDGDYRSFMAATDKEKRRLYVEGTVATQVDAPVPPVQNAPDAAVNANRPVHNCVVCDVCDQVIVGHRYRCLTCYDYDLCMTCESKYRHKDHIMLRIPRPTVSSRMQTHRVFENLEHHARELKLSPESPSQGADNGDVGGSCGRAEKSAANVGPVAKTTPRTELRHRPTISQQGRCPGMSGFSAMRKANAAAAAMVHERAQARFREVLSRYVDPANISGTVETPSSSSSPASSANVGANVAPPSPPSTANGEMLTEAQRSLKLASEAAKVASAAAAASWNTFMGCAGMFVPVVNPSPTSSTTTMGAAENQKASPKQATSEANGGTASNASVVSGLVDEVLKHTPPELKGFLPNEDEMNRLGEKLSTLLSQLGIELNMPPAENEEATSPSGSSSNEAQKKPSDEQQVLGSRSTSSEEAKNNGEISTASLGTAAGTEQETASQSSKPTLETDSVAVGACLDGNNLVEEQKGLIEGNEECSADTSSASLLTDDDEDVLDAAQTAEQSNPPAASSSRRAVPWILVDLPDDQAEEVKKNVDKISSATSSSGPVGSTTSSTSTEKEDVSMDIEEHGEVDETALLNLLEFTKKRLEMLKKKTPIPKDDSLKHILDKVAKELEMLENDQDVQMKEEKKRQIEQQSADGACVPEPTNEKKAAPVATIPSPAPSTSAPSGSNDVTIAAPRTQPAASSRIYSQRPHVNHAIHTMMTMGFSNNEGHLTQLLEAMDGDIPRALDLLMQKLS